jgi:hypothetical protein
LGRGERLCIDGFNFSGDEFDELVVELVYDFEFLFLQFDMFGIRPVKAEADWGSIDAVYDREGRDLLEGIGFHSILEELKRFFMFTDRIQERPRHEPEELSVMLGSARYGITYQISG